MLGLLRGWTLFLSGFAHLCEELACVEVDKVREVDFRTEVVAIFAGSRLLVELKRDVIKSPGLDAPHESMPQQILNRTVVRLGIVAVQIETVDTRAAARQRHVSGRAAPRLDDRTRDDGLAHQFFSALEIGGHIHPLAAAL